MSLESFFHSPGQSSTACFKEVSLVTSTFVGDIVRVLAAYALSFGDSIYPGKLLQVT